jgi:hypothetical protein
MQRQFRLSARLLLLLVVAGCGGGGGDPAATAAPSGPATLRGTVAYVVTECVDRPDGATAQQTLRVIRGEQPSTPVMEVPTLGAGTPRGICTLLGLTRLGPFFDSVGAFQRLAVTPDGEDIVFELTDAVSIFPLVLLAPEERGIFLMHADGTGMRRLAPPSREPTFRFLASQQSIQINVLPGFAFSPSGRTVAFTDLGPGPTSDETVQIFTLDLITGERRQVTHLPIATPPSNLFPPTCCPSFIDDDTVTFPSVSNPDGLNPNAFDAIFTVATDGTGLATLPIPVVAPGSQIVPNFVITGPRPSASLFLLPGVPVNAHSSDEAIAEIFLVEGMNLLQLTNFRRFDTSQPLLAGDRQRVFFVASADPLGGNPAANCQIFSIDRTGGDLQQITTFREGDTSMNGCLFGPPPGCAVAFLGQDADTQTLLTYASCDPFGTNSFGSQIFAVRPDGSGLRQLTSVRGVVAQTDQVTVELPGPFAFSVRPD